MEPTTQVNPIALSDLELPDLFQEGLEVVKAVDGWVVRAVDPGELLADRTQQESLFHPIEENGLAKPSAGQPVIGGREGGCPGDQGKKHFFDFMDKSRLWVRGKFGL